MTKTPPIAALATILLHAALLVAAIDSLSVDDTPEPMREPIKVQLFVTAPEPLPVARTAALPPMPTVPPPKKERVTPQPETNPRPDPIVKEAKPQPALEVRTETKSQAAPPAAASTPAAAVAAPAGPAAPAAPLPPMRTSASEATYASTNRIPPYPRISTMNGDEGTVILRVLVTPDGLAGSVELRSSSGHPLLDESARKTVQTWRFKPATIDGKPVAEWYQVSIPFKLQNN